MIPNHPIDNLSMLDKCRIYYCKVADLAIAEGWVNPDTDSEITHFVLSAYYHEGKELAAKLKRALVAFKNDQPDLLEHRAREMDDLFHGAVRRFNALSGDQKKEELILIGASRCVWPAGTSHFLTYPWDLDGTGRPVGFKPDLTDFSRRRILEILNKAGKLRNPRLFS